MVKCLCYPDDRKQQANSVPGHLYFRTHGQNSGFSPDELSSDIIANSGGDGTTHLA